MQSITKEFKLALFNGGFDTFYNQTLQQLRDNDLAQFVKDIEVEKLEILFYKELEKKEDLSDFLIPVFKNLKEAYKVEVAYQGMQSIEIKKIIEKFSYPSMILKGLVMRFFLQQGLYKRSGDIDLLVHKSHIPKTLDFLSKIGYRKKEFYYAHGEISLANHANQMIDLHYDISVSSPYMSLFKINKNTFFSEKITLEFEHIVFDTFNKEFSLLYLCIHFAINHNCSEFLLLFELKEFLNIHIEHLDKDKIIALGRTYNLLPILYLVLNMVNRIGDFEKIKDFQKVIKSHLSKADQIDAICDKYEVDQYVLAPIYHGKKFPLDKIILDNRKKEYTYKMAVLKRVVIETVYKINGLVYWPIYNFINLAKKG